MAAPQDLGDETWVERVRARPGMYVGSGSWGLTRVVHELVSNALDEFLAGRATSVGVTIDGDTVEVLDDGGGLPFDQTAGASGTNLVEHYCTTLRETRSADNHAPHVHLVSLGGGLAPLCALAAELEIVSVHGNTCWQQTFSRGAPSPARILNPAPIERGTRARFTIDREVFEERLVFDESRLRARLFEAAHLFPGLIVTTGSERFHAPTGLAGLAEALQPHALFSPVSSVQATREDVQLNFAAIGPIGNQAATPSEPTVRSWVNGAPTSEHGHHVSGFRDFMAEREWWPSLALIHVVLHSPALAGPTRGRLNAPHVRPAVADLLRENLPTPTDTQ